MRGMKRAAVTALTAVAATTGLSVVAAPPAQAYLCGYGMGCMPPDLEAYAWSGASTAQWAASVGWNVAKPACAGPMYRLDAYYGLSGDAAGTCEDPVTVPLTTAVNSSVDSTLPRCDEPSARLLSPWDVSYCAQRTVDTEAPSAPTGLTASVARRQVTLRWDPSPASDLFRYDVYRAIGDGEYRIWQHTNSTSVTLLEPSDTTLRYVVRAADEVDNMSPPSESVTARTGPALAPPRNVRAVATGTSVTVTWDPADDPDVTGYAIEVGGYYRAVAGTQYRFDNLRNGHTVRAQVVSTSRVAYDYSRSVEAAATTFVGAGRYATSGDPVIRTSSYPNYNGGWYGSYALTFRGSRLRLIGQNRFCATTATVLVDGREVGVVDHHTVVPAADGTVFETGPLSTDVVHTVEVRSGHTSDPRCNGGMYVDALVVE